ncbi:MAG: 2-oxoacid ferredoxin oxidoreductase [Actinobacteria bacterium HGW-Actinobacteria-7]|jgi:2-oxoglutarate ferredoxin oxidoreductase subunit beta|nr:MAG: 2-oxoacid ferredoxin oxidoreductase [Actinobacteria bacterium HGW-Actinobacteria-7]
MFEALKRALAEMGWAKKDFTMFWGIGCHGNGADFYDVQGFHGLHGRSLPPATAYRLTRPDQQVIVEMGDGDGYGIGLGHFVHSCRRNVSLTAIIHNNQIYGLTAGQASPTTEQMMKTVSTPSGVLEQPVNPVGLALAEGATFVARGFAGDIPHLASLYIEALSHDGFAVVDVLQPCVTWNKLNTFSWFRDRVYKLEDENWDISDRAGALGLSLTTFHEMSCSPETCRVPIGVFLKQEGVPTYEARTPASALPGFKRAEQPRDVSEVARSL